MAPSARSIRVVIGATLLSAAVALPMAHSTVTAIPIPTTPEPCDHRPPHPYPSASPPSLIFPTAEPVLFTPEPSVAGEVDTLTPSAEPSIPTPTEEIMPSYEPIVDEIAPTTAPVEFTPEPTAIPYEKKIVPTEKPIYVHPSPTPEEPIYVHPSPTPEEPIYVHPSPISSLNPLPTPPPFTSSAPSSYPSTTSYPSPAPSEPAAHDPLAKCHIRNVDIHKGTAERCCNKRYPCGSPQCKGSRACENPDMCYCRRPVCRKVYIHYSYDKELSGDCAHQMIEL